MKKRCDAAKMYAVYGGRAAGLNRMRRELTGLVDNNLRAVSYKKQIHQLRARRRTARGNLRWQLATLTGAEAHLGSEDQVQSVVQYTMNVI